MHVTDVVIKRASTRAFLPRPVEGAVVRELIEQASHAPSGGNLQPWRVHALAGQVQNLVAKSLKPWPPDLCLI